MFKYTATYNNPFTGQEMHEDIYCNLTAPELAEFELSLEGGFREHAANVLKTGDGFKVLGLFKLLVSAAYGRRTEDGLRFLKNPEWLQEFLVGPGWEDLFLWLTEDEAGANANKFWAGLLSDRMTTKADSVETSTGKKLTELSKDELVLEMQKLLKDKTPANEVS